MSNKSVRKLFVHATNVHAGGGQSLLNALLQSLTNDPRVVVLLDTRMEISDNLAEYIEVKWVKPSVWQRLNAEFWLFKNVKKNDVVLCFGNLPPLFQLNGCAVVFVQNRYLIDQVSLANFSFKSRLRLKVERCWFSWKIGNASVFIVQTPSMQVILKSLVRVGGKPVLVFPFVNIRDGYQRAMPSPMHRVVVNDFIYVASGEPHKNHRRLVEAWCLLANDGFFPSLWLTLDANTHHNLCMWISQKKNEMGLRIENLGVQPHAQIRHLYTQVRALIYPSTFESFGLPLIEARQAGLAVIASELDFVRDVLDPEEVFDPQSPVSIFRAVKRFMGSDEKELPLLNAVEFLKNVLEKCK